MKIDLPSIFAFISKVLRSIWFYFPGLLFLVLGYLMMLSLPQGKDVIVQATEHMLSGGVMVLGVTFWAYVTWYSSRLLTYQRDKNECSKPIFEQLPRVMGYACFVITQVAIVNLSIVKLSWLTWPIILIAALLYYLISTYAKKGKSGSDFWMLFIILMTGLIGALANYLLVRQSDSYDIFDQTALFLKVLVPLLMIQASLFLYYNVTRRTRMTQKEKPQNFKLGPVSVLVKMSDEEKKTFRLFNIVSVIGLAIYMAAIFSLPFARAASSFTILFVAFGVLLGVGNLISFYSVKLKINLHLIVITLAIISNFLLDSEPYEVSVIEQPNNYDNRKTLQDFTHDWIRTRQDSILAAENYPMIFVMADGGGSRSGYWTAAGLGKIQDATAEFSEHLFMLSGASGGSVGNSTFFSMLDWENEIESYELEGKNFMGNDFLAFTAARLLGPDYFRHVFPANLLPMGDRAWALEYGMQHPVKAQPLFKRDLSTLVTQSGESTKMPALVINTTRMNDGKPGVVSTVKMDKVFTPRIDVLSLVKKEHDLSLSTAAALGARFPYMSPAGDVGTYNYFVDGGYFDNSGAGAVHESIQAVNYYLENGIPEMSDSTRQKIKSKLKIYVLHFMNSPKSTDTMKRVSPIENDLLTPILTLANAYSQQTNVNNQRLYNYLDFELYPGGRNESFPTRHWIDINLYGMPPESDTISMNWVISKYDLAKMDALLEKNQAIDSVINWINQY